MLRIGEFSNLSQVSVKTLHHYNDIGLLSPAHTDAQTGYRYYEAVQLTRLVRIRALKDLGFSLDDITLLLRPGVSEAERAPILARRREEQEKQVLREQQRLQRLQQLDTRDMEAAETLTAPLSLFFKSIPALRVASWRAPTPCATGTQLEQEITARFLALGTFLRAHQIRMTGAGIMLWHDAEWQEDVTDAEVAIPIEALNKASSQNSNKNQSTDKELNNGAFESDLLPHPVIRISELPPIPLAACVTYRGSAQGGQAQAAYTILADSLQAQGFRLDGLRRDVTLHYDVMSGDRVVEVQFPIARVNEEENNEEENGDDHADGS